MKKYVAYYRVSRDSFKDGKSKSNGLGLEAQKQIAEHYYNKEGNCIVMEFTETKSAKNISERPILQNAIDYCLKNDCWLLVAKLDRLSRNVDDVRTILKTLDGNISFGDIPAEGKADMFTITIYSAFAERERELISLRTKNALKVKKEREGSWQKGNPDFSNGQASKLSVEANKRKAASNENTIRATQVIVSKRADGMTYWEIAQFLNKYKFVTANGNQFYATQVMRIYNNQLNQAA